MTHLCHKPVGGGAEIPQRSTLSGSPHRLRPLANSASVSFRTVLHSFSAACFIAGATDWVPYFRPGTLETMETSVSTQWRGTHFVEGAGHWVQQEQAEEVSRLILQFLRT